MLVNNYEASLKLGEDLKAKGFNVKMVTAEDSENK